MRDRGRLVQIHDPEVGMSGGEVLILILIWVAVIALVTFVVVMLYRRHKAKKSSASVQPFNTGLPANQQPGIAYQDPARQMQPAQQMQPTQSAPSFCPRCGNKLGPDAKFCPGCGAPVSRNAG